MSMNKTSGYFVRMANKIHKTRLDVIRPNVIADDISHLNFQKMKDMGMQKIIFGR